LVDLILFRFIICFIIITEKRIITHEPHMPQNAQLPVDQINFGFWLKSHKFLNSCGSSRGSVRFYKGKGSTMLRLFCRSSQKVYVLISANTVPPWFSRYICGSPRL